jgi:diguanylate cyclase (GGDEF)-like protein
MAALLVLAWPWSHAMAGAPDGAIGFDTASWPLHLEPPSEAQLSAGVADDDFVPDARPADTLAPRQDRLQWMRIAPAGRWTLESPPVVALYVPYFNRVRVLAPPDYVPRSLFLRDPGFDPGRSRHAMLVELPPTWSPDAPVYLAAEPSRRLPMRLRVESRDDFVASDLRHLHVVLPLLAILGFITLIVAAFGLLLGERRMLLLAGALCGMFFFQGMILGELYAMPGGGMLAAGGYRALWTARALHVAFLILFAMSFLDARRRTPRLAKLLLLASAGMFLVALLAWVPAEAYRELLARSASMLLAVSVLLMLATALLAWRQGSREAWLFLLAWLPSMSLDMLRELELLGWASFYPANEYLDLVAAIWAAVLFTFGVGERLVRAGRERDAAIDAARIDPLTGALNRKGILERLQRAGTRGRESLVVLFVDLDRFKAINDRHGHAMGDACLVAVVGEITAELGKRGSIGRIGGEEFLVVLPDAGLADGMRTAEGIRARVARECAQVEGRPMALTLSIGVAATDAGIAHADLLAEADAAMYRVKQRGRNGVEAASPDA